MADEVNELRQEIDQRRRDLAGTVDQLENRVRPSRIAARRRDRMHRRFIDLKDQLMGNDEPDYPVRNRRAMALENRDLSAYQRDPGFDDRDDFDDDDPSVTDRVRGAVSDAPDPRLYARRQTRGNPTAAGIISFGIGMLVGSLLPESDQEQELARKAQGHLDDLAASAGSAGQDVIDEVREPAKQAADEVKEAARSAAQDVKDTTVEEARAGTQDVRDS